MTTAAMKALPIGVRGSTSLESTKQAYIGWQNEQEREHLLMEQLPQVHYIARGIHQRLPHHVLVEDLIHAGVIGLMDAFHKYDRHKQVQFGSYAKFRIRGAILDSLREMDWSPRVLRRKGRLLEEANHRLRSVLGRNPNELESATELGMNLRELQTLLGEINSLEVGSLLVQSLHDGKDEDLCEHLPNKDHETPLTLCLRSEMTELLTRAIEGLPQKQRQVLRLYYYEELTMREVGDVLGVGESRVSQIHTEAVIELHTRLSRLTNRQNESEGSRPTAETLTSTGADGVKGMPAITREGGVAVDQDEASCSVYGMPRSRAEMGLQPGVVLPQIPQQI